MKRRPVVEVFFDRDRILEPSHDADIVRSGPFAERTMIALKLRGARPRAAAKNPNYREGRKPFGARPGEQETIARIRDLRTQGQTLSSIAAMLTAEDRKPRAGERWHEKQIARILTRSTK